MFGWFRPRCPCDPAAKRWVEDRLQWLSKQFGLHILLERPIIVPTAEYFPDAWDGSPKAAPRISHCGEPRKNSTTDYTDNTDGIFFYFLSVLSV
jgi:hypothetical protein